MHFIIFVIILLVIVCLLLALLDPRRNALVFMKRHSDHEAGWDKTSAYDPRKRRELLELMIKREQEGESNWYQVYKCVLEKEGITELEVKRAIEQRKSGLNKD